MAGGAAVCAEFLRLRLADELRYSVLPVAIGDGVPFFAGSTTDVPLHLVHVEACTSGMVALRYEVRR